MHRTSRRVNAGFKDTLRHLFCKIFSLCKIALHNSSCTLSFICGCQQLYPSRLGEDFQLETTCSACRPSHGLYVLENSQALIWWNCWCKYVFAVCARGQARNLAIWFCAFLSAHIHKDYEAEVTREGPFFGVTSLKELCEPRWNFHCPMMRDRNDILKWGAFSL